MTILLRKHGKSSKCFNQIISKAWQNNCTWCNFWFFFLFSRLSQQEGLLFLDKNKTLWQPTLVLMKLLSAKWVRWTFGVMNSRPEILQTWHDTLKASLEMSLDGPISLMWPIAVLRRFNRPYHELVRAINTLVREQLLSIIQSIYYLLSKSCKLEQNTMLSALGLVMMQNICFINQNFRREITSLHFISLTTKTVGNWVSKWGGIIWLIQTKSLTNIPSNPCAEVLLGWGCNID